MFNIFKSFKKAPEVEAPTEVVYDTADFDAGMSRLSLSKILQMISKYRKEILDLDGDIVISVPTQVLQNLISDGASCHYLRFYHKYDKKMEWLEHFYLDNVLKIVEDADLPDTEFKLTRGDLIKTGKRSDGKPLHA